MAQAHAFLGNNQVHHTFKFNPDSANWDYKENVSSTDTIGGRVVQLLSVNVGGINVQGKAGSRAELQRLADNIRSIMEYHIKTSLPVNFKVPSRGWNFLVFVQAMPQVGWDFAATSYPYQLNLAVVEDLTGVISRKLEKQSLTRLADGIGYNPAVHGGNTGAFNDFVDTVLRLSPDQTSGGGGGGGGGGSVSVQGYHDPFRDANYSPARIDMGVDYCGSGKVYAIGPAKIINVGTPSNTTTFGSDLAMYELIDGPAKGKGVYFGEHYQTEPGYSVGDTVDSNTVLYRMTGGCIEIGWTDGGQDTLAHANGGYYEGQLTAAGENFNDMLIALGSKSGTRSGRPTVGSLPSGWPQWKG